MQTALIADELITEEVLRVATLSSWRTLGLTQLRYNPTTNPSAINDTTNLKPAIKGWASWALSCRLRRLEPAQTRPGWR